MKKIFFALLTGIFLLAIPPITSAQVPITSTSLKHQVLVRLRFWDSYGYDADFDTNGQSIGGLSETELNKKFLKIKSAVAVLDFMALNGYKTNGFTTIPAGTGRGNGPGFGGYALLFEQKE